MRADLHTHSIFSDGELIPAELVRTAKVTGHKVIAITDHVDMTNVEFVVKNVVKAAELTDDEITVIPGVEITKVKYAPMGDPAQFMLHGYELTLRLDDAAKIEVTPATEKEIKELEEHRMGRTAHPGLGVLSHSL